MTVEDVVSQLRVTPRTLRYYEEIGLITPAGRSSGGHRLYDQPNIDRLQQIFRLKDHLGFTLQEIREILDAEESLEGLRETFRQNNQSLSSQQTSIDKYIDVLNTLVAKMDAKIESISTMRNTYQERLERSQKFRDDEMRKR